jgi:phosphoglycolate phosphatase
MTDRRTLLFDLDGTLLDTAPDMAYALNRLLSERQYEPLPFEHIRGHVSHGANALTRLGFQVAPDEPAFASLRKRFLEIYADNLCRETRLFSGMESILERCERIGTAWGVVTNKPSFLTDPLLRRLGLWDRAACVVSGDTLDRRKPHPEPLLHACRIAGGAPDRCIYVGDAERDIEAGRRAGMTTLVATFGYLTNSDRPEDWGADGLLRDPVDLLHWLDG